jgi:energy-coupling factor transporter ATP-binding protein EcfA2
MLTFELIDNNEIFAKDFRPFVKNNEICFPKNEKITAIYGPNGTGKTSLIRTLAGHKGTKLKFAYDGIRYSEGSEVFHIINDQNNRNIIEGKTKDFFLGDNIKREFELQEYLSEERNKIIGEIISKLKTNHSISAASSPLINLIDDIQIAEIVKDIVNSKSKGKNYTIEDLIERFKTIPLVNIEINEEEQRKLNFLKSDYASKDSVIKKIDKLGAWNIQSNPQVHEIEENTEAISILERFKKDQCIVCDTPDIDWQELLMSKSENRTKVVSSLDKEVKSLIEKIIDLVPSNDPFMIKRLLLEAISSGNRTNVDKLIADFLTTKTIFNRLVMNELSTVFTNSDLQEKNDEYQALISEKPEITEEDMLYIEEIISTSMNKKLVLERGQYKNLKITLSNQEFLGKERGELPLSTGEQNFLSLTFEFLKAKNSTCPIVVIDDPISSFDSIYKNKVSYAIVKMLHHKKRIVLTHNTDLLRLLDGQYKKCYKLYLLNNTDGEENGFVPISYNEQEMLISLEKLLSTFRNSIFPHIQNVNLYLISMIPFMRGYANILDRVDLKEKLTQLMHGYKSERINIAQIYIELFGNKGECIPANYEVSVTDILSKTVDGVNILDKTKYPLLDKTLRHSFLYLYLRLLVEKKLVEKFKIDTSTHKQLGQIINAAYPDENEITQIRNRIRLTSKKTLINEFNHFEGNLSIFQPAIDITDHDLLKERSDIVAFINGL